MTRRTLNLGILAHVDAGKTTLTERLLYAAGVIGEIGSVDAGTTQTDSLALERQRGITIKSAVVSFAVGGVTVNLIDTPGHPDFIAEVERVLSVLDGAVLVISAVEGVQPQTRVLMRALRRLRIPALLFVNKIDRAGAGEERVLRAIAARLSPAVVPMGSASGLGTRAAGFTPWARGRRRRPGPAGRDTGRTGRGNPRRLYRRRAGRAVRPAAPGARGPDAAGPGAPRLLRLRGDRGGRAGADGRPGRAAAGRDGRRRRPGLRPRLQDRARPRRREARLRPDVLRHHPHPRPPAVQRQSRKQQSRGQGHRDRRVRARHRDTPGVRLGRPDRQAARPGRDPDRRPDRRTRHPRADPAAVRPADAGIGHSGPPARRPGRAARRPGAARRAGPADQRPAVARRAGGLALRGGAEGGHPGHAGR